MHLIDEVGSGLLPTGKPVGSNFVTSREPTALVVGAGMYQPTALVIGAQYKQEK
jgi:hypothetical protein